MYFGFIDQGIYPQITPARQAYTIPVIATLDYEYHVVMSGGVPDSWIIDFSDPVIGMPSPFFLSFLLEDCVEFAHAFVSMRN